MNAMILAAGLGTRLLPFTASRPKALFEVDGKPLLQHVIERLKEVGVHRLVVNIHHHADQVEHFLKERDFFGMDARLSDERAALLDTGGAVLHARPLFLPDLPVLLHNVDILSDVDLVALRRAHDEHLSRATLVVQPAVTSRVLRFAPPGFLSGWEDRSTGEQKIVSDSFHASLPFSFCGIQLLSPAFLRDIHHRDAFSIIDELLVQARLHQPAPRAFLHDGFCIDAGQARENTSGSVIFAGK
ncbi:MAG: NTP transferase domain-containing protein [Odoribacteraceae bacterium]|jgi:NDP-sugar pyrophosphorylase family protein|nr:NTP transferase domain-containing protein [Odoribacteraceae bacterium]